MIDKTYTPNYPIILGICGEAGTGKTSLADRLAPPGSTGEPIDGFIWDHIFFAAPIYEMAAIKTKIEGEKRRERILYELHTVIQDLFGGNPIYGAPDYDELIGIVKYIAELPIERDRKPRTFMQTVGAYCRSLDPDCFVSRAKRLVKGTTAQQIQDSKPRVLIISDVRQDNEAEMIRNQPNGIMVRLTASEDVRRERMLMRDGTEPTEKELKVDLHQVSSVAADSCDHIIETDYIDGDKVVEIVKNIVLDYAKE